MKFIVRFDDICNQMDIDRFLLVKNYLDNKNIKSILGVIPDNRDRNFQNFSVNNDFWDLLAVFKSNGDLIAQHGFQHIYHTKNSGILGINKDSEFAGLSYNEQLTMLKNGKDILVDHNMWQPIFMAPSHSFDLNTIKALKNLGFTTITDGFSLYPYFYNDMFFLPQLFSSTKSFGIGVYTICLHTNTISDNQIKKLFNFIDDNEDLFIDPNVLIYNKNKFKSLKFKLLHMFFSGFFYCLRFLKKYFTVS